MDKQKEEEKKKEVKVVIVAVVEADAPQGDFSEWMRKMRKHYVEVLGTDRITLIIV